MAKLLEEWKEDLVEALTEHDLLLGSKHQKIEHAVLLVRNIAVGAALVLFLLTDCFTAKVPHKELFMAYCFGPMYILLGLSYLLGH